ncbi:unnamed protein product, partial [Ilex paraguariensis]
MVHPKVIQVCQGGVVLRNQWGQLLMEASIFMEFVQTWRQSRGLLDGLKLVDKYGLRDYKILVDMIMGVSSWTFWDFKYHISRFLERFDFEMRQADLLGNKVVKDRCFTEVSSAGQLPTQARLLLLQDLLEIKALRRKNISEYLGMETMLAVVCKTYSGVKALETYEKDGSIVTGLGLHGLGASIGRPLG